MASNRGHPKPGKVFVNTASGAASGADLVAEAGGAFVVFVFDRLVELFAEGLGDLEMMPDLPFQAAEALDVGDGRRFEFARGEFEGLEVVEIVHFEEGPGVTFEPVDPLADGVDCFLGAGPFQSEGGGGLSPVEKDAGAKALVTLDVFGGRAEVGDEIHQVEAVLGVAEGTLVVLEREEGDTAVVELHEFAVGLGAVFGRHRPSDRAGIGGGL